MKTWRKAERSEKYCKIKAGYRRQEVTADPSKDGRVIYSPMAWSVHRYGQNEPWNSVTVRGLITPRCSDDIWGPVGPMAVRVARWWPLSLGVVLFLCFGSPDRDGQYFSPREV